MLLCVETMVSTSSMCIVETEADLRIIDQYYTYLPHEKWERNRKWKEEAGALDNDELVKVLHSRRRSQRVHLIHGSGLDLQPPLLRSSLGILVVHANTVWPCTATLPCSSV
jgi:hypothetical protein